MAVEKIDGPDFCISTPSSLVQEVRLWRIDLDALTDAEPRWRSVLSPDEIVRAGRFHFDGDRRHYCAARGLLRIVLAAYLAGQPEDLRFRYSEKGKPELAEPHANSGLTFNVSHSGGIALLGVTRNRPIGVDVERIRDDFDTDAIARRFFSPREQEQLASLPIGQRRRAFFRCWTLKEAFIKALGEGLSHPLHQFDVALVPESPVSLTTRPEASEAALWQLQPVDAGPGHAAAIAVKRH